MHKIKIRWKQVGEKKCHDKVSECSDASQHNVEIQIKLCCHTRLARHTQIYLQFQYGKKICAEKLGKGEEDGKSGWEFTLSERSNSIWDRDKIALTHQQIAEDKHLVRNNNYVVHYFILIVRNVNKTAYTVHSPTVVFTATWSVDVMTQAHGKEVK